MTTEARVDYELFAMLWFLKLEQKYAGREVVDIRESKGCEAVGKLVCYTLDIQTGEALLHGDFRVGMCSV